MSVVELNAVTGVGQWSRAPRIPRVLPSARYVPFELSAQLCARGARSRLRPVFAAYEGYRIDTAWGLVWSAMMTVLTRQTSAVPLPALGIGRRRDKGARCGARLRPPLIGAPVTHWNSDANKLL